MKRLLFLAVLSTRMLSPELIKAQEVTISGVSPESFSGVYTANNGDLYYVVYMDATAQDSANVMLKVFDRSMQTRREVSIPVAKGTQIAASTFTGQFYVLQLANVGNKTRSTIFIDEAGNVVRRKDETDIKTSALSPVSFPIFYPISMNEYLAVRTNKDDKPVVEFELMDSEAHSRWSKTLENQNASDILELKTELDRVYLLKKERLGDKEVYAIQSLSGITGDNFFTTELREGDNIAMPTFFDVQQGFITSAGLFRKDAKNDKPEGLFFARLSPTGMIEKIRLMPWGMIKAQVKSSIIVDLESGKTGILMQGAVPDVEGAGVTLVGELYKKTAGAEPGTASFTTQDFVLIHTTGDGQVDKFEQVSKPGQELLVKGILSSKSSEELAQWLDKNNFFAYRTTVPVQGKNVIAYLDNNSDEPTAYFATIDSNGTVATDNVVPFKLTGQAASESGRDKRKNKENKVANKAVLNSTEKDLHDFAQARLSSNIIQVPGGHVLMYNYANPDIKIWLLPVQTR